jgi:pentatricopeptide repeat protein
VTYSTLLTCYARAGKAAEAEQVLQRMLAAEVRPNEVTYNTLLTCYARAGKAAEAEQVLQRMLAAEVRPDEVTYTTLALSHLRDKFTPLPHRLEQFWTVLSKAAVDLGVPHLNSFAFHGWLAAATDPHAVVALLAQLRRCGSQFGALRPRTWKTALGRLALLLAEPGSRGSSLESAFVRVLAEMELASARLTADAWLDVARKLEKCPDGEHRAALLARVREQGGEPDPVADPAAELLGPLAAAGWSGEADAALEARLEARGIPVVALGADGRRLERLRLEKAFPPPPSGYKLVRAYRVDGATYAVVTQKPKPDTAGRDSIGENKGYAERESGTGNMLSSGSGSGTSSSFSDGSTGSVGNMLSRADSSASDAATSATVSTGSGREVEDTGAAEDLGEVAKELEMAMRLRGCAEAVQVSFKVAGLPAYAMPFCAMQTLHELALDWHAQLLPDLGLLLELAAGAARGVAALHARNIVHRDVKPENFLVEETAGGLAVKVADFGLCVVLAPDEVAAGGRHGLQFAGTRPYMAPEQLDGGSRPRVGPACDVWALGCVLLEVLTGGRVWQEWPTRRMRPDEPTEQQLVDWLLHGKYTPLLQPRFAHDREAGSARHVLLDEFRAGLALAGSAAPPEAEAEVAAFGRELWAALEGCLQLDPGARWSARALADVLEELAARFRGWHAHEPFWALRRQITWAPSEEAVAATLEAEARRLQEYQLASAAQGQSDALQRAADARVESQTQEQMTRQLQQLGERSLAAHDSALDAVLAQQRSTAGRSSAHGDADGRNRGGDRGDSRSGGQFAKSGVCFQWRDQVRTRPEGQPLWRVRVCSCVPLSARVRVSAWLCVRASAHSFLFCARERPGPPACPLPRPCAMLTACGGSIRHPSSRAHTLVGAPARAAATKATAAGSSTRRPAWAWARLTEAGRAGGTAAGSVRSRACAFSGETR